VKDGSLDYETDISGANLQKTVRTPKLKKQRTRSKPPPANHGNWWDVTDAYFGSFGRPFHKPPNWTPNLKPLKNPSQVFSQNKKTLCFFIKQNFQPQVTLLLLAFENIKSILSYFLFSLMFPLLFLILWIILDSSEFLISVFLFRPEPLKSNTLNMS